MQLKAQTELQSQRLKDKEDQILELKAQHLQEQKALRMNMRDLQEKIEDMMTEREMQSKMKTRFIEFVKENIVKQIGKSLSNTQSRELLAQEINHFEDQKGAMFHTQPNEMHSRSLGDMDTNPAPSN